MEYKTTRPSRQRPNYGIDAPGLVKGFFLGGATLLALALCVNVFRFPSRALAAVIATFAKLAATYSFGMGCYMLYGSLFGKVSERHRQLELVPWGGSETVLDVGCGRGLLLVAAAKRVPLGRVVGIDIWQAEDQSGNQPQAALANARAEGVAHLVQVQTADARQIPFADGSFDVVVSHWVVHNLPSQTEREQAVAEIARVLKPGGYVMLADIEHHPEYIAQLNTLGFVEVRHVVSRFWDAVRAVVSFGSFRPGVVLGHKPA